MKPQPMLTVLFVKRLLFVFIAGIFLLSIFHQYSSILFDICSGAGLIIFLVLYYSFPSTQITVDEESIYFSRKFPRWHPLKKYHLHELTIPHDRWDMWVNQNVSTGDGHWENYYLFFNNDQLAFAAKATRNTVLESWIQKKFPDRPMGHKFPKGLGRFDTTVSSLKEKDSMNVFI